jgi:hypothetical protein
LKREFAVVHPVPARLAAAFARCLHGEVILLVERLEFPAYWFEVRRNAVLWFSAVHVLHRINGLAVSRIALFTGVYRRGSLAGSLFFHALASNQ